METSSQEESLKEAYESKTFCGAYMLEFERRFFVSVQRVYVFLVARFGFVEA